MITINASRIDEWGYATDMLVDKKKSTLEEAFREVREAVRNEGREVVRGGAIEVILTIKEKYASIKHY